MTVNTIKNVEELKEKVLSLESQIKASLEEMGLPPEIMRMEDGKTIYYKYEGTDKAGNIEAIVGTVKAIRYGFRHDYGYFLSLEISNENFMRKGVRMLTLTKKNGWVLGEGEYDPLSQSITLFSLTFWTSRNQN